MSNSSKVNMSEVENTTADIDNNVQVCKFSLLSSNIFSFFSFIRVISIQIHNKHAECRNLTQIISIDLKEKVQKKKKIVRNDYQFFLLDSRLVEK